MTSTSKVVVRSFSLVGICLASVAAAQPRSLQVTAAGDRVLINKTVGGERWAITYHLDDDTVTGNVYFESGQDPAFFDCTNTTPRDLESVNLACSISNPGCGASPPSTQTCPQEGEWQPIATEPLPRSFFGLSEPRQIESFDSDDGWVATGIGTRSLEVDTADKVEGTASLRWTHTVNEQITKNFDRPQDLSRAAELRLWIRANRKVGSACCGFTLRLISSSGSFERQVLPDIPAGAWVEDVSERDAWYASGAPSWNDIRGVELMFYGDSNATVIQLDDFRWSPSSSTSPTARASARAAMGETLPPGSPHVPWIDAEMAAGEDGSSAFVTLEGPPIGFVGSANLYASDFGFAIPAGVIITGIRVEIKSKQSVSNVSDREVVLMKDGNRVGANRAFGGGLPSSEAYRYYGGETDLWGVDWTAEDINSPRFGVSFAVQTNRPPESAFVDDVRVGIYYRVPQS